MMLKWALPPIAALLLTAAAPPPAPDPAPFEQAMARKDFRAAALIVDEMVKARLAGGAELRPDPLLSGMVGRVLLLREEPSAALAHLEFAMSAEVPAEQRIAALLARASVEETLGDLAAAAASLDLASRESLSAAQQREVALSSARIRVADDPRLALTLALPLAARPGDAQRWEAELVVAQAHSLLGDPEAAAAAAERAWIASAEAPALQYAPLRVALVRAGLAAAAHRPEKVLAMLSFAGSPGIRRNLDARLPLCGVDGVLPADQVVVAVLSQEMGETLAAVAASRPAAVSAFLKALGKGEILERRAGQPAGSVITLSCRSAPSGSYRPPAPAAHPGDHVLAMRGIYPVLWTEPSLEQINAVSTQIAELAARYGEEHPFLIGPRQALWGMLLQRAAIAGDVEAWQPAQLHRKLLDALRRLEGTQALIPVDYEALAQAMAQAGTPEAAAAALRAGVERQVKEAPLDLAYDIYLSWRSRESDTPDPAARRITEALLARFKPPSSHRRRIALLMRLAELQHKAGDVAAAAASHDAAGLPADACIRAGDDLVEEPRITEDDYPVAAIAMDLEGVSSVEIDISAKGELGKWRTLVSAPSSVFDPVIAAELSDFKLRQPIIAGRPRACKAYQVRVVWKLPQEEDGELDPFPDFKEADESGT